MEPNSNQSFASDDGEDQRSDYEKRVSRFYDVLNAAQRAGDPHPEIIAAQWALESGWGSSPSGKNNLFGIKARGNEAGTVRNTHEYVNGRSTAMPDKFRDYDSIDASMADRVKFTRENGRYARAGYFQSGVSSADIANALQKASYGTDAIYAKKLTGILKGVGINPQAAFDRSSNPYDPVSGYQPNPRTAPDTSGLSGAQREAIEWMRMQRQGINPEDPDDVSRYFGQRTR
ncbi:glycoside hydrolase family 73 protein [Aquirhabdus sp.]|uniref:glycoside hydrolase family 73 protein n=1 Tax=Aquirhabdus sp. TaxID=2824160 RepID=UPI00396C3611